MQLLSCYIYFLLGSYYLSPMCGAAKVLGLAIEVNTWVSQLFFHSRCTYKFKCTLSELKKKKKLSFCISLYVEIECHHPDSLSVNLSYSSTWNSLLAGSSVAVLFCFSLRRGWPGPRPAQALSHSSFFMSAQEQKVLRTTERAPNLMLWSLIFRDLEISRCLNKAV